MIQKLPVTGNVLDLAPTKRFSFSHCIVFPRSGPPSDTDSLHDFFGNDRMTPIKSDSGRYLVLCSYTSVTRRTKP